MKAERTLVHDARHHGLPASDAHQVGMPANFVFGALLGGGRVRVLYQRTPHVRGA